MTILRCDFEGGNDANDGSSFALRFKTLTSGATAARIAPGDVVYVMGTPDPTLIDATGSIWTQDSKTVTLSASVTQMICDCESAWTSDAGANGTVGTSTSTFKEGTKSASLAILTGFTTGLFAHFATGTLNLSGYQQVSFWIQNSIAVAASTLSLRLCSDTAGVTTVDTIVIPALPAVTRQTKITVDTAGALGSSIASIALYCDIDPGILTVNLDNIIACKASSSADALTLQSLIGKKWNQSWVASATYAANDIVKPTQPNRNGFRYKVTAGGGGAAGGSEPTWPTELGITVVDGALTWTCEGLEDTWYPIQSINGVTVKIDNDNTTLGSDGPGYSGATETVPTYKRECINLAQVASDATIFGAVQDSGTQGNPITFSGGWDRTAMTVQNLETWVQYINCRGIVFDTNSKTSIVFENINVGASGIAVANFNVSATSQDITLKNCHGRHLVSAGSQVFMIGFNFSNGRSNTNFGLLDFSSATAYDVFLKRGSVNSNVVADGIYGGKPLRCETIYTARNQYGFNIVNPGARLYNCVTRNNVTDGVASVGDGCYMFNCLTPDGIALQTTRTPYLDFSQNDQQVAGAINILCFGGSIVSDASVRHTAAGASRKFNTGSITRGPAFPLRLSVAKVACLADVAVTLSIWTRRDTTHQTGQFTVRGGQIAGVPNDVVVQSTPSINTWVQTSNLVFTPTADGVVDVEFLVWTDDGNSNNYWCHDFVAA